MAAESLFEVAGLEKSVPAPLADRLRPQSLDQVVGQSHLLGPDGTLTRMLEGDSLGSLILWGPPGTGKTTLARLIAKGATRRFEQVSAIFSGVADLKKLFSEARDRRKAGQATILFVDEIHRFNRAQLDAFLPVMEDGTLTLIGATTQNPSFELTSALLSRAHVLVLNALDDEALSAIVSRAEAETGQPLPLTEDGRAALIGMADGDGRAALTLAEDVWRAARKDDAFDAEALTTLIQKRAPIYDKSQDGHYNLISALHKSIRGSDPDAALYYLCRMLEGGEDPLYLARRLVRMASEDIGLADPQALSICIAARDSYQFLGSPEGELALAQAAVYLAVAPKSNGVYVAYKQAHKAAKAHGSLPPPKTILNAPTSLMKEQGYGAGYAYDHDEPDGMSGQDYFPEEIGRQTFYDPPDRGFERDIRKRLEWFVRKRSERSERAGRPERASDPGPSDRTSS
jgi:putative ATPase